MLDAALDLLDGQGGAELEHLDVLGFDQRLERGEVHVPVPGRAVVAAGKLHVVDVEAEEAVAQGFQMHGVLDEPEVLLDLGVAGVVPIDQVGAGDFAEQELEIALERQFLQGLAVFDRPA